MLCKVQNSRLVHKMAKPGTKVEELKICARHKKDDIKIDIYGVHCLIIAIYLMYYVGKLWGQTKSIQRE